MIKQQKVRGITKSGDVRISHNSSVMFSPRVGSLPKLTVVTERGSPLPREQPPLASMLIRGYETF